MDQGSTIVVGVDGSSASIPALDFAYQDAVRRGARLRVIAAVELLDYWGGWRGTAAAYTGRMPPIAPDLVAEARAEVQALVNQTTDGAPPARPPVPIEIDVTTGRPARVLLNAAQDADLLVLGHCGRGTLASALLGSVGLQCVLHAPCPVTIVRTRPTGLRSAADPLPRPT